MNRFTQCLAACALFATAALSAQADTYPSKPIRLVVPFGPGGITDIIARQVALGMAERLGQQVFIENKPSAGHVVALQTVAQATPDGYTILLGSNTGFTVTPHLYQFGHHVARRHRVHPDAVPGPFTGHGLGHCGDAGLCRAVGIAARMSRAAGDGTDVHDDARLLGHEHLGGLPAREEGSAQVHGQDAIERLHRLFQRHRCLFANAGIVDQHVQAVMVAQGLRHQGGHLRLRRDVYLEGAVRRSQFMRALAGGFQAQVGHDDAEAVTRQTLRNGPTNAVGGPGDDGDRRRRASFIHDGPHRARYPPSAG